jgi:hypothetical protein
LPAQFSPGFPNCLWQILKPELHSSFNVSDWTWDWVRRRPRRTEVNGQNWHYVSYRVYWKPR